MWIVVLMNMCMNESHVEERAAVECSHTSPQFCNHVRGYASTLDSADCQLLYKDNGKKTVDDVIEKWWKKQQMGRRGGRKLVAVSKETTLIFRLRRAAG